MGVPAMYQGVIQQQLLLITHCPSGHKLELNRPTTSPSHSRHNSSRLHRCWRRTRRCAAGRWRTGRWWRWTPAAAAGATSSRWRPRAASRSCWGWRYRPRGWRWPGTTRVGEGRRGNALNVASPPRQRAGVGSRSLHGVPATSTCSASRVAHCRSAMNNEPLLIPYPSGHHRRCVWRAAPLPVPVRRLLHAGVRPAGGAGDSARAPRGCDPNGVVCVGVRLGKPENCVAGKACLRKLHVSVILAALP